MISLGKTKTASIGPPPDLWTPSVRERGFCRGPDDRPLGESGRSRVEAEASGARRVARVVARAGSKKLWDR